MQNQMMLSRGESQEKLGCKPFVPKFHPLGVEMSNCTWNDLHCLFGFVPTVHVEASDVQAALRDCSGPQAHPTIRHPTPAAIQGLD